MSDCPRNFSREELLAGLKAGRILNVDRRDAPELEDLMEWQRQGLVDNELIEVDDQYSYARFRWVGDDKKGPV